MLAVYMAVEREASDQNGTSIAFRRFLAERRTLLLSNGYVVEALRCHTVFHCMIYVAIRN